MIAMKKLSQVFGPLSVQQLSGSFSCKSQKLFLELGFMRSNEGMITFSPFLVRALRKLEKLARKVMDNVSAQEIILPTLTSSTLLEKSGRSHLTDLFKLEASKKNYILSPTHEEAVTNFLGSIKQLNIDKLPCRLYQISNKFRDEKRVKSGLLRSKEFIMKDLYCFDKSAEESEKSYQEVVKGYKHFFELLNVPYLIAKGTSDDIGGLCSHEFHFPSDVGEDKIILCNDCGHNENCSNSVNINHCLKCESKNVKIESGIEVGHTFNLGTRYSEPFKATYLDKDKNPHLLHMSCFGLGLTRILAGTVEVLCTDKNIVWPTLLAPYLVCVIPPKAGSIEENVDPTISELIYNNLNQYLPDEVVYFDDKSTTVGKRLMEAKNIGFPFVVLIGKKIKDEIPCVEIHNVYSGDVDFVQIPDIIQVLSDKLKSGKSNSEVLMSQISN